MSLSPGSKLAHYEIVEPIGKGGMGEVYRAKDTKLGRDVAIKVLPEEFSRDKERLARFKREAKVLASLNHPNIASIYGLEQSKGTHYLVLELVEGVTLAERIARGPIPFEEARDIAIKIAEALAEAHERGIVHRDLKPANIKLTSDGKVKVLDFGLAKALVKETPELDSSMSPTLTRDATRIGVILGTAAYMSPEQAKAKPVDRRTDIFAFGAVVYEMLTAKKAFTGENISDVLAAVIKSEPQWDALPASTPPRIHDLVRKCLRKVTGRRLQHIGDARVELEDSETSEVEVVRKKTSSRRPMAIGFSAGMITALVLFWTVGDRLVAPPPSADSVLRQLTANPIENTVLSAAISPDGKYLAFADLSGLTVRLMETGETHPVPLPQDLIINAVDWFPDGTTLLLEDDTGLWKTSIFGGTPRRLARSAYRATVSSSGSIAYLSSKESPSRQIFVTGPDGENPHAVVDSADGESFWELAWSPDGQWLLFGTWKMEASGVRSIQGMRIETGQRKVVVEDARLAQNWRGVLPFLWTPDGRLVYARREQSPNELSSNLWSISIDADATVRGEPSRLTQLTGVNFVDLSRTANGAQLAFLSERNQSDVYVGELPDAINASRRLTLDERDDYPVGWLASDRAVVFATNRTGSWSFFRLETDGTTPSLIASGSDEQGKSEVSTDGRWVFHLTNGEWNGVPVDGGPGERLALGNEIQCNVGATQRCLLGERDQATSEYVFYALDPIEGKQDEVARIEDIPPFINWDVSPDGKSVAVVHLNGRIRVVSLVTQNERELAVDGWSFGEFVAFAADGRSVFVDGSPSGARAIYRKSLLRVSLDASPEVEELRQRRNVWHVRPEASPDGRYLAFAAMTFSANVWMIEDF